MSFFTMIVLALADLGNIFAEFAGIASGMGIFGVSKYVSVPIGTPPVWYVIAKGSYKPVERIPIHCVVTDVVAFFIVVACAATLFKSGHGEINLLPLHLPYPDRCGNGPYPQRAANILGSRTA